MILSIDTKRNNWENLTTSLNQSICQLTELQGNLENYIFKLGAGKIFNKKYKAEGK